MTSQSLRLLLGHLFRRTDACGSGGLPDAELLQRFVQSQDQAAFEVLVWRHGGMVVDLCQRFVQDPHDVEDAFQATFLALVRKAGSIGKGASLASWLYKVAYRVALAARVLRKSRVQREGPWFDLPGRADDDLGWRELRPVLDEEVSRLPEKYRSAFVLCCLEGKTNEEAAMLLGCPKGTVLSRLARARARLRLRLTRRGLGLAAGLAATLVVGNELTAAVPASFVTTTLKAVGASAAGLTSHAGISSQVTQLTEGVIHAMFVTKCKNALLVVLMLALVGVGAGIIGLDWISGKTGSAQALAQQNKNGNEKNTDKPNPATNAKPVDAIKRMQLCLLSQKNLKVIGVALHNFNDTYRLLPAPAIYSKDGKPLLSWRVTLLPFIEQDQLYKQFKLDEPWDSRHNKKLLARMPRMYAPVGGLANKPGVTYYQALVGKGAAFEPRQQLKFPAHFADGTSNTIMVVEAGSPVPWTKPQDLPYVEDQALPKFGGLFSGDFNALFADGAVHFLSKNADPDNLRAAITRAGGDLIDLDKMKAKGLGFADGQQLDGKTLPGVNARLKKVIEATLAEVEKTRKEVELLKLKARGIKNADAQTLKLLQENAKLQEMLERALSELEKLRQQKEQLGKVK